MNVIDINRLICTEIPDTPDFLPHLVGLQRADYRFRLDFGLAHLPDQPGMLLIRGARQYGKSTWLEQALWDTVTTYGPGSAYYMNGDDIRDDVTLAAGIQELLPMFSRKAPVRRLFIDEITAVHNWQRALKRLADQGALRDVLVVTTGSRASDLRHGSELLPGRKGKLDRTTYLFVPISYAEFQRVVGPVLGSATLDAYCLTGGSPVACAEIAGGRLPEYVLEIVKDWIAGEFARADRSRSYLVAVMEYLLRRGGCSVSQAGLARETGMANNTVASGYIEKFRDLMCLAPAYAWDAYLRIRLRRKPCKLPFCNLLVALAWHPLRIRSVADYRNAPNQLKAVWTEWMVAQELWRRAAISGAEIPEELIYWQGGGHEVDFVVSPNDFLEVKLGASSPLEFTWFPKVFPNARLRVINRDRFETDIIQGITLEDFLLEKF